MFQLVKYYDGDDRFWYRVSQLAEMLDISCELFLMSVFVYKPGFEYFLLIHSVETVGGTIEISRKEAMFKVRRYQHYYKQHGELYIMCSVVDPFLLPLLKEGELAQELA